MGRILVAESPFFRLPSRLEGAQLGWLLGLKYGIEISDLAKRRLLAGLTTLRDAERHR